MTKPFTYAMVLLGIALAAALSGCQTGPEARDVPAPPAKVLIIGDSISMERGYLKGVRKRLGDQSQLP